MSTLVVGILFLEITIVIIARITNTHLTKISAMMEAQMYPIFSSTDIDNKTKVLERVYTKLLVKKNELEELVESDEKTVTLNKIKEIEIQYEATLAWLNFMQDINTKVSAGLLSRADASKLRSEFLNKRESEALGQIYQKEMAGRKK